MVKVFLTGGSGFIAAHVLNILIEHGFEVVTTVRSTEKGDRILAAYPNLSKDKLSYVIVEDIAKEGAFDEVLKSGPAYDYVIHTASPFHYKFTDPIKEILEPAINGTKGILKAIKAYVPSVKRVVITSSFAAITHAPNHVKVYDESVWNPVTIEEASKTDRLITYRGSKTWAEKSAWEFVEKEKPNFDIATINPPLVFGPVISYFNSLDNLNTSNEGIRDFAQGKKKNDTSPTEHFQWVDVRDVALAHVKAVEVEEAGGKRFLTTAGFVTNQELAEAIRETHPKYAPNLPEYTKVEEVAYSFDCDNSRIRDVLGIKFKTVNETVNDTIESLVSAGL